MHAPALDRTPLPRLLERFALSDHCPADLRPHAHALLGVAAALAWMTPPSPSLDWRLLDVDALVELALEVRPSSHSAVATLLDLILAFYCWLDEEGVIERDDARRIRRRLAVLSLELTLR